MIEHSANIYTLFFQDPFEKYVDVSNVEPFKLSCEYDSILSQSEYDLTCTVRDIPQHQKTAFEENPKNKRVKRLVLIDSNTKVLPQNIGKAFPALEELAAKNLNLEFIATDDFLELPFLRKVDLSNNMLTSISPETFDNLPALESLNLGQNKIKKGFAPNIPNLKTLSLGGNEKDNLDSNTFSKLPELKEINIADNNLEDVDENIFQFNPELEKIWLTSNKIKKLSPTVFDGLKKLQMVDLRDNQCIDNFFNRESISSMINIVTEKCKSSSPISSSCVNTEKDLASCKRERDMLSKNGMRTNSIKKENDKLRLIIKVRFFFVFYLIISFISCLTEI